MKVQFKSITVLAVTLSALLFAVLAGAMCHRYYKGSYVKMRPMVIHSPVAYCTTGSGTNISLPAYSCCQLVKVVKTAHHKYKFKRVWGSEWVAGACRNADPRAIRATRCGVDTPIHGTGMPILGQCQFSYSTKVN